MQNLTAIGVCSSAANTLFEQPIFCAREDNCANSKWLTCSPKGDRQTLRKKTWAHPCIRVAFASEKKCTSAKHTLKHVTQCSHALAEKMPVLLTRFNSISLSLPPPTIFSKILFTIIIISSGMKPSPERDVFDASGPKGAPTTEWHQNTKARGHTFNPCFATWLRNHSEALQNNCMALIHPFC